ncbi:hypothetical protein ACEV6Q_21530 [Enterobacter ludwigii]|uniref:hypothetical protein n=1 Tax=Enterobacter ludwigii TaxID=299767 RepID=UPI003BEF19DD
MTMRNPVPLDVAEYRSGLACSLWSAILEKASDECSQDLLNLLSLACDINHEVHVSLSSGQGGGDMVSSAFWNVRNEAENALNASKEAREVLTMWLDLIPGGDEHESESLRVGLLVDRIGTAISHLETAVATTQD